MYITNLEERNKILEKDMAKLQRQVSALEDKIRLNKLSSVDTTQQMIEGRGNLYDRLQECLDKGGPDMKTELDIIIQQIRLRTGSYGVERKNMLNNLFKSIIDLSFPNVVKWLFIEANKTDNEGGLFE